MAKRFYKDLVISFFILCGTAHAQSIPVGSTLETPLRSLQLLGKLDPSNSFCVRPLQANPFFHPDTLYASIDSNSQVGGYGKTFRFLKDRGIVSVLPASIVQQINTHHPYGWNDGAMIPANGYQTLLTAGVYASLGPLDLQLQPEFVYAANSGYQTSALYGNSDNKSYQKLFWGQSGIGLSAFSLSIGVSTANLWWGPGNRSSLLMSNNAPGFAHVYFRTQKPIKTPVGSFEWQLIGGNLSSDQQLTYENRHLIPGGAASVDDRYLNAFVFSYQPKWIPGLFLGMTRSLQRYTDDLDKSGGGFFNKYMPVLFKAVAKQNAAFDDTMRTDQLASFFLRWAFFKAKAECYFEYGYNDYGVNTRDYLMGPSHSAAYTIGFRKMIPRTSRKWIEFGLELTQMSQSPDWLVRDAGNWYVHNELKEGYTNQNQIIGSGAGLGSNVFSLDLTWVDGKKRLGFLLERVNRDPQYHSTKWVDLGLGVLPQWEHRQFLFAGKFELVKSRDYMWQPANTVFNLHSRFIVQYNF